jgi:hypothetical protein
MALPVLAGVASAATKQLLGIGGKAALRYAARNFVGGAAFGTGQYVAGSAMQWLSDRINGNWNSDDPGPSGDGYTGCQKASGGYLQAQFLSAAYDPPQNRIVRFFVVEVTSFAAEPYGEFNQEKITLIGIDRDGPFTEEYITGNNENLGLSTELQEDNPPGAFCEVPAPTPPPPAPDPFVYTDPETSCKTVAVFQYWSVDEEGRPTPVYLFGPDNGSGGIAYDPADAADGCWYQPVVGGGDGENNDREPEDPITIPSPGPGDDQPIYQDPNVDVAKKGAELALAAFWLTDGGIPGEYVLLPSCINSNPPEDAITVDIPAGSRLESILYRSDALAVVDQGLKTLKQPICNERPVREGEWRTISFRSEETSPFGSGRLRKRFRYLSVSGFGLEQLVDYWAGFSFEAGPVIVSHIGASWGEPKVWASTADEGKRVIRHAGGEAGLDPDQVGQWQVSSSRNPRFGVSGTMNVDTTGGYFWITCRDGSSERPIVAKT